MGVGTVGEFRYRDSHHVRQPMCCFLRGILVAPRIFSSGAFGVDAPENKLNVAGIVMGGQTHSPLKEILGLCRLARSLA
jgi:hypothetical protein